MSKKVCIIGGGVIGLCAAWYARQQGQDVTVLERHGADYEGCSQGNAGMIVPSHFVPLAAPGMVAMGLKMLRNPRSPFYIRPRLDRDLADWGVRFARAANAAHVGRSAPLLRDLNLASRAAFEELSERFGNGFGLAREGLLMLCKTEHALEEEARTAQTARDLGIPAEVLTPKEAEARAGIRLDTAGAVFFPHDCHLSPPLFVRGLTQALQTAGVALRYQTEVTGWRTEAGRVRAARTSDGDVEADEYVIAGGSWSPAIVRDLKLRLPIQAGKGYGMTVAQPPALPKVCAILTEARVAITPMGDTLRVGGTMEIGGINDTINPLRVQGIQESLPKYLPDFSAEDFRDVPIWHGLRPCSPDGLPYIGRFSRYSNLTAATGHAMMGLSLAPITGKLVAQVLSEQTPEISLDLLSPDRFA